MLQFSSIKSYPWGRHRQTICCFKSRWFPVADSITLAADAMKSIFLPVLLFSGPTLTMFSTGAFASDAPMLGFTPNEALQERKLEGQFDAALKREDLRNWMQRMTAHPHHLGSPYDKELSEFVAAQFRSWGYETEIEQFDVLFPTPKTRLLEMTAPEKFTASLSEPALPEDSTSSLTSEQLPTYNACSLVG